MTYFIIENNSQQGPFTIEQLAQRSISSETLVWAEGMINWTPAWQVEELRPIISGARSEIYTSSRQNAQTDTHPGPPQGGETQNTPLPGRSRCEFPGDKRGRHGTSWFIGIIALLVILLLLVVTNPTKEAHGNAIRKELTEALDNMTTTRSDDIFEQGLNMIGRMMGQHLFEEAIGQIISYHNYGVFSTCTVGFDGRPHKVSFGCLGHVWTMNSEDIEKAVSGNASVRHRDRLPQDENQRGSQDDRQDLDQQEEPVQQDDQATDNGTSDLEEYVQQQTDKALDKMGAKMKEAVKNRMKEAADSTSGSEVGQLVDKILELLGI